MAKQNINNSIPVFEQIKKTDEKGNEFWSARELAKVLEYSEYRHFLPVVEKAKEACKSSKNRLSDHFEEVLEMVKLGSGANRQVENITLSRYACYLIVQNASPEKEVVALGQTYFAVQTRLREIQQSETYQNLKDETDKRLFLRKEMAEHNKKLAIVAKYAGVIDPIDYAIFQNFGYQGLYGGLDAKGIHSRKGLKKSEQILDHMGSTELAANLFRATQAEEKLKREGIKGKQKANDAHFEVGKKVKQTIKEIGGAMPENLPVADSIKKLNSSKKEKKSGSKRLK